MRVFNTDYAADIAAETGRAEWQNATIRIIDNRIKGEKNIETGEYEGSRLIKVYEGQARVQPNRAGVDAYNQQQANKTTLESLRIQLPHEETAILLHRGWKVFFLDVPRNRSLQRRVATVSEDTQSSHAATRTFDAFIDGDAVVEIIPDGEVLGGP